MSHQSVNQTSFEVELYTPPEIIDAARQVLGVIDLDPASSATANQQVKAAAYYTQDDDGLNQPWYGNVWMNHPWGAFEKACSPHRCQKKVCMKRGYHRDADFAGNHAWISKLHESYVAGAVKEALCITYASTSEKWFKTLKANHAMCLLDGRTSFRRADGTALKQNTKGCAVTYLGTDYQRFNDAFHALGDVCIPYRVVKELLQ